MPASSRVLHVEVTEADDVLGGHLNLPAGAQVVMLKRLRLAGTEPMGIQTAYIPFDLAPGLASKAMENGSLYEILQTSYALAPTKAQETYFAVLVEGEDARLLSVPEGSPGLAAERISYLSGGRPLEFTTSVMRGDRYRIKLELVKDAC
jgi:GntR family transcriptional regulator